LSLYAGKLRHILTVEQPSAAADSYGQPKEDWKGLGQIHCYVEPLSGEEIVEAKKVAGIETHRITTRWNRMIDTTMRLTWKQPGGKVRVFQIVSVSNVEERNRELLLLCKESDSESEVLVDA